MLKAAVFAFFPVPVCVWLMLVGLALLWFTRRQVLGKSLMTAAFALLLLVSNPVFADWVISGLERQYDAFVSDASRAKPARSAQGPYVVVLSGELNRLEGLPPTSRLGYAGLMRLIEGVRIHKAIDASTLVLSGGSEHGETEAAAMAELAATLGVARQQMITETRSLSTYEQVQRVKEIVGIAPVILVTSASHMPRAMQLFRDAGLDPMPAPTAHVAGGLDSGLGFIPTSGALSATSQAFYEALAFLKAKALGRL